MGCQRLTYHQKYTSKTESTPIFEMGGKQCSDYQVGGMLMPGRAGSTPEYRYGFNGMEKDDEVSGEGNSYTTYFRHYDPRLVRFKSLDPAKSKYPSMSPYSAFGGNPIIFNDPNGDTLKLTINKIDAQGNRKTLVSIVDEDYTKKLYKKVLTYYRSQAGIMSKEEKQELGDFDVNMILTIQEKNDGSETRELSYEFTRRKGFWEGLLTFDMSGSGETIPGGEHLTTKDGGTSPTKTKSKHGAKTTDVTDLLEASGAKSLGSTGNKLLDKAIEGVDLSIRILDELGIELGDDHINKIISSGKGDDPRIPDIKVSCDYCKKRGNDHEIDVKNVESHSGPFKRLDSETKTDKD